MDAILVLNLIGNLLIGISYLIVVGYSGVATSIAIFARDIKNINLRIKTDGSVYVSANTFVTLEHIEEFVRFKENFIINAIDKFSLRMEEVKQRHFQEYEMIEIILNLCRDIYPYFKNRGIEYPTIKFRSMVSQWGNCHFKEGVLTFSKNLVYVPMECIECVVAHEFTHFLQPNHSKKF